ncbi:hypothetical protein BJ508DRAFT_418362 [Ascobolus immersus RN42]|uniref:Post-SET domain-containing protein n=1 Tax=Ascobolus immersus RN42 TaxID=1160509 RepID=A0A3N4HSZ2_ASCIM|nr:hypothetical protein BJ508DRAFT_418362 [Ascobolus immersus RN42]
MSALIPHWSQPSHPTLFKVESTSPDPNDFASRSVSLIPLKAGQVFTRLTTPPLTLAPKAYSTVQVSPDTHIELNSDLVYINHSCNPSLVFDMSKLEIRATRDIAVGDELTFFYPSTEWEMAQPFKCNCSEKECKGWIGGAAQMSSEDLKGYWLNPWIERAVEARFGLEKAGLRRTGASARELGGELGGDTTKAEIAV